MYAQVFRRFYDGTIYTEASVTRYTLNGSRIVEQERVLCTKEMWQRTRQKIFNNLGFRTNKNPRIKEDNLCFNTTLGNVQVLPSFILMKDSFPADGRVTFTPEQLLELPPRIAPWDSTEAEDINGSPHMLRDFMVVLTSNDYTNHRVEAEDERSYREHIDALQSIKGRKEKLERHPSQKSDLYGYVLGSDKYGYESGLHYVDVVCAEQGRGKHLMQVYKHHFNDLPTLLYANIEVVGFYHKLGFKLGKNCDDQYDIDLTDFPRTISSVKGLLHPKHREVGELSIRHGLGLRDLYEKDLCHKIRKQYEETRREEDVKKYLKQFCYQNVAMVYCPTVFYSKNDEYICKRRL
jgi:hypothetical protein